MHERQNAASRCRGLWIGLALALGVIAIYGQSLHFDFVAFDDDQYVFENPTVSRGLSRDGLAFAFSKGEIQINHLPHPLTWLSHMLDVELYGLAAGGHHATSFLLHALASVLLFIALRSLTGATWRSAAAAALWAWHPLRVESVAWVSERKDVLAGVFGMLTLICYADYARRGSRAAGFATLPCYALGLLAKPTLVTLPFALLLLDIWPLARKRSWLKLVLEKTPLFALAALSSLLTIDYQRHVLIASDEVSPAQRAANAVVAIARYLGKFVWPRDLAVLYPHPYLPTQGGLPLEAVAVAAATALVLAITLAVLRARAHPHLAVGWLWFLGMLVPTIGIVHVGRQALADRYSYLPTIGLGIAIVWGVAEVFARVRAPALRRGLCAAASGVLVGYGFVAFLQVQSWRDSETLFRQALRVSPRASAMSGNLATWLRTHRRFAEAETQYRAALAVDRENAALHFDLGRTLHAQERIAEAIEAYRVAAALDPTDARAPYQLGLTFELAGRLPEAGEQYRRAAELDPQNPKPRQRLATLEARLRGN